MDYKCTEIGGLEASLKLNYVLVVPTEQAAMLHSELLARGVPERQIYEVDPNKKPHKSTICGPADETNGAGGRSPGRAKRFMPGSIRLGAYIADGQQYYVHLRWGSVWISMADRVSGADVGGASEVTVTDGEGASNVSPIADSGGIVEVPPVLVDNSAAVVAASKEDGINMPMEDDGSSETDDTNLTGRDCKNDNDDPNFGNGDQRCNSSSTLCEDCKRWLVHEYFGDRSHDELSELNGRHACIYRRIVDRLFVVTVTESGSGGDDVDEDEDDIETVCCNTTTLDDMVVERPSTATDFTTNNVESSSERDQLLASPTTLAQSAPSTPPTPSSPVSPVKRDRVDVEEKPKNRTFFGKFYKSNKKKKKNIEPPENY